MLLSIGRRGGSSLLSARRLQALPCFRKPLAGGHRSARFSSNACAGKNVIETITATNTDVSHQIDLISTPSDATNSNLHDMLQHIGLNFHDHATLLATSVEAAEPGWYPTDATRWIIESMHTHFGLEWWAAIAATTIAIRTMLLPLTIKLMRSTSKLQSCKPEIAKLVARQNAEKAQNPNFDRMAAANDINAVYAKHGTHPVSTMALMFTQMPIFVSMFVGLRKMETYYPDICQGGAMWFPDLSAADPLHYLPVMASATFCTTILLGDISMGDQGKIMKRFMLGMGLITIPLAWNFPSGVVLYWVVNNSFSIVQTGVLNRVPGVKPLLGILPPPSEEDKDQEIKDQFAGVAKIASGKISATAYSSPISGMAGMPAVTSTTQPKTEDDDIKTDAESAETQATPVRVKRRRKRKHKRK